MAKLKKKGIIIISVIAVAIIGLIGYRVTRPDVTYETEKIESGTVVEEVSVTGSIAPMTKVELQSEASSKVTDILVEEGDVVEEGDILLRLDSRDLSARIAGASASVDAAKALLNQYEAGATEAELQVAVAAVNAAKARYDASVTARIDAERALDNAKTSQQLAQSKIGINSNNKASVLIQSYDAALTAAADAINRLTVQMYTGDDKLYYTISNSAAEADAAQSRIVARDALVDLQAKVASSKADSSGASAAAAYNEVYADLQDIKANMDALAIMVNYIILDSTTISGWQLNISMAQTSMTSSIQSVSTAKSAYDLQESLNDSEINAADSAVTAAETALNNASHAVDTAKKALAQFEADYQFHLAGVRPEQIAAQKAQVRSAQANLSSLYADLAKRRIEAPIDGIITKIHIDKGESATMGRVLVEMSGQGNFEIMANISEVDIADIKVGNAVNITLDAFTSEEEWSGKIVSVDPAEKVVEGVIFYEIKIVFNEEDPRIKSGMTANLEIETGRKDGVPRLPITALREKSGKRFVLVMDEQGKAVEREIQTGLENSEYMEVTEGLTAGEEVVTAENKRK